MARNVRNIARRLGAKVVSRVPETGGGTFGAARLVDALHKRLMPSTGLRPGRPTDPTWVKHPKVPMSAETVTRLETLAAGLSTPERKVSPMQVAALLLETSVEELADKVAPAK